MAKNNAVTVWADDCGEHFLQVILNTAGASLSVPLEIDDLKRLAKEVQDALDNEEANANPRR